MSALLAFVNNYKTYIVCAVTIVYTWSDYLINVLMQSSTFALSSNQIAPMDFHTAMMITLAALGAAGFRHAIQKNTDAVAAPPLNATDGQA